MEGSLFRVVIRQGENEAAVQTDGSETLLVLLQREGFGISAACGGSGKCGQCRVCVEGFCRETDGSLRKHQKEWVRACCTRPAGDLRAEVPAAADVRTLADAPAQIPGGGEGCGLAVDIGTTTVAAYLYDLASGACLGRCGGMNRQRAWGDDVISRILYASRPQGLEQLCGMVRGQILEMARFLCADTGSIRRISIAGNTVMEHLFAGLSPESIGAAPFTPLDLFGREEPANAYLEGFAPGAVLYLCPAVAGYVGGDITAGLMSRQLWRKAGKTLYIDIGTNGEMALGGSGGILCCATAAGPAFEGAGIACGSPAQDGAIDRVEPDLSYMVIGGSRPRSICGSGVIDAIAALLQCGRIDETGRLDAEQVMIGGDVYLSARDVRQIQLAKAAIRAGIETLLVTSGTEMDEISEVLIAGGFGSWMRAENACAIGMLPPGLMGRIRHVGNSAGNGAALALTEPGRQALEETRRRCCYLELSGMQLFNANYMDAMMFGE